MPTAEVNGTTLSFVETGSGEPVLLIHGTGACQPLWTGVVERLSPTQRVINYDRRAFGQSPGPPADRLAVHADDAAALLDHLEAAPATVVGWSGGGTVALGLAAAHPEAVTALVLLEPALHMGTHPSPRGFSMLTRSRAARLRRDKRAAARAMYGWAARYTTGGNAWDDYPLEWREAMLAHAPSTVHEMDQQLRPYPPKAAIAAIACPVTCVVGTASEPAFHTVTRFLRGLLPEARLVEVDGASHMLATDAPDAVAGAVRELAGIPDPVA